MSPYVLELEMPWRLAELRRHIERSHQLANLLTRRFRSWREGRRPGAVRAWTGLSGADRCSTG
jgi:hypothetical protein